VLTLTAGPATPTAADFQAALRQVTFDNPLATSGSEGATAVRTLTWTLDTADPRQISRADTSMVGPPPPADTGPSVGPPPVPPPTGLFPPTFVPLTTWFAPPPGITFTFTLPSTFDGSFLGNPGWISSIFSSGPGGMPSFFEIGGFSFTIGPYGTISVFTTGDAQPSEVRTIDVAAAPAASDAKDPVAAPPSDTLESETTKVAPVAVDGRQAAIDRGPDATDRDFHAPAIGIDFERLGEAGLLVGALDLPAEPDTAPVGKPGLSAQLRAAGRQGFLNDRQGLLNGLRDGLGG
jgi:hypothetical protein